jgi:hypothetical protein
MGSGESEDRLLDYLATYVLPDLRELIPYLKAFSAKISIGAAGGVGLIITLVTCYSLYASVEQMFNDIWRSPNRRGVVGKFLTFYALVTLLPVLGASSIYWSGKLVGTNSAAQVLGPLAIQFTGLVLTNKLLPNLTVKWRAALMGAAVSGIAIEALKWGFLRFAKTMLLESYGGVYGPLALVAANDAAGQWQLGQAANVFQFGNTSRRHDRQFDRVRHLFDRREVRPDQHAVGFNVGVNECGQGLAGQGAGQLDGRGFAGLQPAVGGHPTAARVDAQRHAAGKLAAHRANPVGLGKRRGADDHAGHAQVEQPGDRGFIADAATELAGNVYGAANRLEGGPVLDLAALGSVEIDQVQAFGPLGDPAQRHRGGFVAKYGLARVIALLETHALATADINRWPNLHAEPRAT